MASSNLENVRVSQPTDDHDAENVGLANTSGSSRPGTETLPPQEEPGAQVTEERKRLGVPVIKLIGRRARASISRLLCRQHHSTESSRPDAVMPVSKASHDYNMNHLKRGLAIIFVHDQFQSGDCPKRPCAAHDAAITKNAFKQLGYEIEEHWNVVRKDFVQILKEAGARDHQECDSLVVVFMSHGGVHQRNNKEFLWTFDQQVDTSELWKNFTAEKCLTLAGKPKMFFIQACRGKNTDKGVAMKRSKGMRVQTDSPHIEQDTEDYVIPLYSDMLMMWASYPGMPAFKSMNNGIQGSVFIHFLAQVLREDARSSDLSTMLLRVTREVAVQYMSYYPDSHALNENKQMPYIVSTLLRRVQFFQKT